MKVGIAVLVVRARSFGTEAPQDDAVILVDRGARHDFHLVLHWRLAGRERRVDHGSGNLSGHQSSGESERGLVQLARQCLVGSWASLNRVGLLH